MNDLAYQHIVRRINMRHNPAWLLKLARWIGKKRSMLAQDWACTKQHCKSAVKFVLDYRRFRQHGFTRKASLFNARNAF